MLLSEILKNVGLLLTVLKSEHYFTNWQSAADLEISPYGTYSFTVQRQ